MRRVGEPDDGAPPHFPETLRFASKCARSVERSSSYLRKTRCANSCAGAADDHRLGGVLGRRGAKFRERCSRREPTARPVRSPVAARASSAPPASAPQIARRSSGIAAGRGCYRPGCIPTGMTLTNLDLQQLDPATGAVQAQSNSAIDNVEQVRSPGAAATAIYKVKATSTVDGLPAEPFALAARRPLTPLATPQPAVTVDVAAGTQRAAKPRPSPQPCATRRPTSPPRTRASPRSCPAGVELRQRRPDAQPRHARHELADADLHMDGQGHHRRAQGDHRAGQRQPLRRDVHEHRHRLVHGRRQRADADDRGTRTATTTARTRRRLGRHRHSLGRRRTTTSRSPPTAARGARGSHRRRRPDATYAARAGHRYRFRVRATDALGNTSRLGRVGEARSPTRRARRRPTRPAGATTDPPAKADPKVTLARVKRTAPGCRGRRPDRRRRDRHASPSPTATKVGRKTYRARRTARIQRGRFNATLKLAG